MSIEVRPVRSPEVHGGYRQVRWGDPGQSDTDIDASVDPWFSQFGTVSDKTVDLARLAAAAYVTDRLVPRRAGYSRTMRLHVHLVNDGAWSPLLPRVEQLLSWISGDAWELSVSRDGDATQRLPSVAQSLLLLDIEANAVSLLSGGLDSFSGAVLKGTPGIYVSHTDNPMVTAAQTRAWTWLAENGVEGEHVRVSLREAGKKRERTTRTRALLFYALAIAVADSRGIGVVEVPENGFTGLNLSLGNDRGGVLSTRSTHPWTMHLMQTLLDDVGIDVRLTDPYEWQTKGELVRAATSRRPAFEHGLTITLSCAKLDGARYKGGDSNLNCGLCVACLTRRGAVRAAGIEDKTEYLATTLHGSAQQRLKERRGIDVLAVMSRVEATIDEFTLLENGPYPDDFDLTAAADLCRRGFAELAVVLPELS